MWNQTSNGFIITYHIKIDIAVISTAEIFTGSKVCRNRNMNVLNKAEN